MDLQTAPCYRLSDLHTAGDVFRGICLGWEVFSALKVGMKLLQDLYCDAKLWGKQVLTQPTSLETTLLGSV